MADKHSSSGIPTAATAAAADGPKADAWKCHWLLVALMQVQSVDSRNRSAAACRRLQETACQERHCADDLDVGACDLFRCRAVNASLTVSGRSMKRLCVHRHCYTKWQFGALLLLVHFSLCIGGSTLRV